MDVLILAAGLGSRLSKYTHNIIPKFLIDLDDNTGLFYLITYWSKYTENIYLVIHSKYTKLTEFYIKNLLSDFNSKIKIINYDESDGTAYTLNNILSNTCFDQSNNILLTWCDLYPKDNIDFNKLNNLNNSNNIFIFTNGNKCRYNLTDENKIIHSEENNGNIIGIYYFQNFKKFNLEKECINNDIVIYLDKVGNINNFSIDHIIDYGDEIKMNHILENKDYIKKSSNKLKCRFFNSIEIIDKTKLLKKGINDKGKEIIKKEKNWYEYTKKFNTNNLIPKIFNIYEFAFLMEYKENYITVNDYISNNIENDNNNSNNDDIKKLILKNIIDKIKVIHNLETINVTKVFFFNNLKKEIYDKIIERRNIIIDLINYFGNIKKVNNVTIDSFENILNKCKNIIIKYYETIDIYEYSIILGDCQFSNILINKDNLEDIVFIDPRGYFGDSLIHGPTDYDYAKILYAISGYDNFNLNYFNIDNIDNENINFEIKGIFFEKNIINKYFNKVHKAYLVIIWLSLAEYNKNNIWKSLASYYYGLYLGTLL